MRLLLSPSHLHDKNNSQQSAFYTERLRITQKMLLNVELHHSHLESSQPITSLLNLQTTNKYVK